MHDLTLMYSFVGCTPVIIRIIAEFDQQAIATDSKVTERSTSTTRMKKLQKKIIDEKEGHGSLGVLELFTLSASALTQFEDVNNMEVNEGRLFFEHTENKKVYDPNFLQLIRRITTEVSIGDMVSRKTETDYVGKVPIDSPLTSEALNDKAREYIERNVDKQSQNGDGQDRGRVLGATGHIYEDSVCLKLEECKS